MPSYPAWLCSPTTTSQFCGFDDPAATRSLQLSDDMIQFNFIHKKIVEIRNMIQGKNK